MYWPSKEIEPTKFTPLASLTRWYIVQRLWKLIILAALRYITAPHITFSWMLLIFEHEANKSSQLKQSQVLKYELIKRVQPDTPNEFEKLFQLIQHNTAVWSYRIRTKPITHSKKLDKWSNFLKPPKKSFFFIFSALIYHLD